MEPIKLSYHVEGGDLVGAGEASSQMKMTLKRLDLPPDIVRRCSICMYEGEINMVIHADGGTAEVEIAMDHVIIRLADTGPGIPDIDQAMEEGFSTAGAPARDLGFGAGMGLPNMKRYSDEISVESALGVGTTVTMRVNIP